LSINESQFPRLVQEGYRVTSPATERYNCIAWAAGDSNVWWDPDEDYFWPADVPRDYKLATLILVFEGLGFRRCEHVDLADGKEKIAIYQDASTWHHAARQLADGKWTSKLGPDEDIEHLSPDSLADWYGSVILMSRELRGANG
jgi:hypothetical protein